MNTLIRTLRLATTIVAEVAVVVALSALGARRELTVPFGHLTEWLRTTPAPDVVVASCRAVALVGAWWVLAGTLLYAVACVARAPGAMRAVAWAVLPAARRAVDTALFVSVAAVSAVTPAAVATARTDPPPATVVRDGHGGALGSLPATPPPTPRAPSLPPAPAPASAVPVPPAAVPAPPEDAVVVAPGDSLWELAARHLAAASARPRAEIDDADVAPYWVRVCDRNRAALVSGDPNLIFPGERVVLPPLS
jgi:hypothetical protein